MLVWILTTKLELLATSLHETEQEAYVELAHQLFGEDSETPNLAELERLLILLDLKERDATDKKLDKFVVDAFEEEMSGLGGQWYIDCRQFPGAMTRSGVGRLAF